MSNRFTRGIDVAVHHARVVIALPPKGAYALALLFMLVAYAIHDYQVREYYSQLQTTKYEQTETKKLEAKQAEQPASGSKPGC
jgi:hypothetical protein